jgi:hypothetical protein
MLSDPERKQLYKNINEPAADSQLIDAETIAYRTLPFIHRGIRNHTMHGLTHSMIVLEKVNELIDLMVDKPSQIEIRLLYISSWLHDIGNLKSRANHSVMSCRFLEKLDGVYIHLGSLKNPIKYIIKYHQSEYDLSKVPNEPYCSFRDPVRLPFLCALFRLADGCHMGEDRAFKTVYHLIGDDLNEKSKKHWIANNLVTNVSFDRDRRKVIVIVANIRDTKILTEPLKKDFEKIKPYFDGLLPLDGVEVIREPRFKLIPD